MTPKPLALAVLLALSSALAFVGCSDSEGSAASSAEPTCFKHALSEGGLKRANRNTRSHDAMVPGRPDELLLCRYYGFGDPKQTPKTQARFGKLEAERLLRRSGIVRSIGREFNGLRKVPRGATYSCPEDDGAVLYAIFQYVSEPAVPVEMRLGGCGFAGNGQARAVFMSSRLRDRLERLVQPPS